MIHDVFVVDVYSETSSTSLNHYNDLRTEGQYPYQNVIESLLDRGFRWVVLKTKFSTSRIRIRWQKWKTWFSAQPNESHDLAVIQ